MTDIKTTAEGELINSLQISKTDAEAIISSFQEVAETIGALDKEIVEVVKKQEIDEHLCAKARKLRLRYSKARTLGDRIHKDIKANVLLRSKAIDGARNIFKLQITERENQLGAIEKHFENLEKERKEKLAQMRMKSLEKFDLENVEHLNLGEMDNEVWEAFYNVQKQKYEEKQAEIKRLEEEQKEKERKEKIGNERREELIEVGLYQFLYEGFDYKEFSEMTDKDFKKLKGELEELKEKKAKEEAEIRKENERLKKEQEEKEVKLKKEQEERADNEAKLKQEREKKAKLEAELRAKEEAEAKEKAEKEAREKEAEKARKNKKYLDFLKSNHVSLEDINKGDYQISQNGTKFILLKKIDEITIN